MGRRILVESRDGYHWHLNMDDCQILGSRVDYWRERYICKTQDGKWIDVFEFYRGNEIDIYQASRILRSWGCDDPFEERLKMLAAEAQAIEASRARARKSAAEVERIHEPTRVREESESRGDYSGCETLILKTLGEATEPIVGRVIAELAGLRFNSHFRSMLRRLVMMGRLAKHRGSRGYSLSRDDRLS